MIPICIPNTRGAPGGKFSAVPALAAALLFAAPVFGDSPARGLSSGTPELNSLDGRRFEFTRLLPFSTFSDIRISLKLPGNWSGESKPYVDNPILHGVNSASGATATVESFDTSSSTNAELVIGIDGLASAGDYDLPVRFNSSRGDPVQKITLNIRASDGPVIPVLVVCLGVVAGMGSQYLARQRPTQLLRADVAQARSRVLRLLDRATAYQVELAGLSRKLADIDLDAGYQEPLSLRTRLEAVETRITEIEQQRSKQRTDLQTDVRSLTDRLDDQSGRWIDLDTMEKAQSDELASGIATIQQAIAKDQLDEADDLLRKAKKQFGSLITVRAKRFLAGIEAGAAAVPEAERIRIQTAEAPVLDLLGLGPLDVLDKLPDLNQRIVALERVASASHVALPLAEPAVGRREHVQVIPADAATAADVARRTALQRMAGSVFWLTVISAAVALVTGWQTIYLGRGFGSFSDYVTAFVWGFGLNAATRSAADIVQK